ncbi:MAG TPA: tRNA (guanosine(37)-N1)-methyltransferase TrmD [Deltaproteobacteria bacterium]|nr:tRNA (guanosine(37)-N1)-methyltransferase TrmD [Deltaproteobacteria bacterium]
MLIHIITLFPGMFEGVFQESILARAAARGLVDIRIVPLREFGLGTHRVVDDTPYGGGGGMVLKPEPIAAALESLDRRGRVVLTTPRGSLFTQNDALRLSREEVLTFICGHYEGVDERVSELLVDEELSIGDYVLTGGELPAMVMADAVVRLIPDVLGKDSLHTGDSHYEGLLEHPQYTRPREFRGMSVPEVLLSGDHARIQAWRRHMAREKTIQTRPDLLSRSGRAGAVTDSGTGRQGEGDDR